MAEWWKQYEAASSPKPTGNWWDAFTPDFSNVESGVQSRPLLESVAPQADPDASLLGAAYRANEAQMGPIFAGNAKRMAAEVSDPIAGLFNGTFGKSAAEPALTPGMTLNVNPNAEALLPAQAEISTPEDAGQRLMAEAKNAPLRNETLRELQQSGVAQAKRGGAELEQAHADLQIPESGLERYAKLGLMSAGPTLAGVAAGALTRSPNIGAGVSTMFAVPSAYGEARDAGHTVDEAIKYAGVVGGAEAVSERLGFDAILGKLASKIPAGKLATAIGFLEKSIPGRVLTGAGVEGTTEALSQVAQDAYKVAGLGDHMSFDEFKTDIMDSFGAGAMIGGPLAGTVRVGEQIAEYDPNARRQQQAQNLLGGLEQSAARIQTPESQAVDAGREAVKAIFAENGATADNVPEMVRHGSSRPVDFGQPAEIAQNVPRETTIAPQEAAIAPPAAESVVGEPELIRNGSRVFYPGNVAEMRAKLAEAGLSEGMRKTGENGEDAGLYFPAKMQAQVDAVLRPRAQETAVPEPPKTEVLRSQQAAEESPEPARKPPEGVPEQPTSEGIESSEIPADEAEQIIADLRKRQQARLDENADPLTEGFKILGSNKDAFRNKLLPGKTMGALAEQAGDTVYARREMDGNDAVHVFKVNQGKEGTGEAKVYDNGEDVWIDVSGLKSGGGAGERIYNLAYSFAKNNGRNFKEDPSGLSDTAVQRRPVQQLAAILKSGSAETIKPGDFLGTPRPKEAPQTRPIQYDPKRGFEPTLREHVLTVYDNTSKAVPEIKGISYDADNGRFVNDATGKPVSDADFDRLASDRRANPVRETMVRVGDKETGQRLEPAPVGRNTLKTAVLAQTLLRAKPSEVPELLGQLRRIASGELGDSGLSRILPSKRVTDPQTETPAFKKFFEGSKVVDEDGKPMRVYHGTGKPIDSFAAGDDAAKQTNGNRTGAWGSYFTASPKEASIYAEVAGASEGSTQNVVPAFLSIKNPYVMSRTEWGKHSLASAKKDTNAEGRKYAKDVRAEIESKGHDGIVIRDRGFNDEWVAFHPTQIKSATGNDGTFDATNPDIRRSASEKFEAPTKRLSDAEVKAAKESAEKVVASHWGRGAVSRLKNRGRVEFVTRQEVVDRKIGGHKSVNELDGVDGFYDPDTGKAYVVADSGAKSADMPGVLSHEIFHANGEQFLGSKGFQRLKDAFRKLKSRDKDIEAAYKRVPKDTKAEHVDEEGLAYLAQEAPKHRLVQRLEDEAKLFLNRLGVPLDWLNAHGAAVRKIAALNLKDAGNRGAVARFNKDGVKYQKVFHGTPHRGIEKEGFKLQKIGTGEGAQAYGFGLYFASNKDIAEHYRKALTDPVDDAGFERLAEDLKARSAATYDSIKKATNGGSDLLIGRVAAAVNNGKSPSILTAEQIAAIRAEYPSGQLYHAEIPEDSDLLDYDKPLSEQPEKVKAAIAQIGEVRNRSGQDILAMDPTGEAIYKALGEPETASSRLNEAGIPGLRYLDGSNRNPNLGNAALIRSLEKFPNDMEAAADDAMRGIHGGPAEKARTRANFIKTMERMKKRYNYVIWDENLLTPEKAQITPYYSKRVDDTPQTETPEFKRWSGGAPVFKPDEIASDYEGGPAVFELYHGTTADFDTFSNDRANPESDMGAGFYFSNTPDDVGSNYAGLGPDLTNKIEREAERIAGETDREYDDPDVVAEARSKFMNNDGATLPVFVRTKNPAILGGEYETRLTYEESYDKDTDEYGEPEGTLVDFIGNLREAASNFNEGDVEAAISSLFENGVDGDVSLSDVIKTLKESEEFNYYTDDEGNMVSNEVVRQALEWSGFDSVIDFTVDEKFGSQKRVGKPMEGMTADTVHVIAFKPNQIKSSIGNSGAFSDTNPSILASKRTPELESAMEKAGYTLEKGPLRRAAEAVREKIADWREYTSDEFKQSEFDRFHGIKYWEEKAGNIPDEQSPYIAARLSTGAVSAAEFVLSDAGVKWKDGILQPDDNVKSLFEALKPVRATLPEFMSWMAGKRAQRLMKEGRENNFTQADIDELLTLDKGREAEFKQAAKDYADWNKMILDVGEQAGLINPESRKIWENPDYIPFIRSMVEPAGVGTKQTLANQRQQIKTLKGGKEKLQDPMTSIIQNAYKMIDASMKNHAMLLVADQVGHTGVLEDATNEFKQALIPMSQVKKALLERGMTQDQIDAMPKEAFEGVQKMLSIVAPSEPNVVRIMRDGKAEYYRVNDPLLLRSLTAFKDRDSNAIMSVMRGAKRLLTAGATATPGFIVRNWIRDTAHSYIIHPDKMLPGFKAIEGVAKSFTKDPIYRMLAASGAGFGHGRFNAADPGMAAKQIKRALKAKGWKPESIQDFSDSLVNTPAKLWSMYQKLGAAAENANRYATADKALKSGKSAARAAYEAKDMLDFSMQGDSHFIQFLADTLPFFNARLQGLYKLQRAGAIPGMNARGRVAAKGFLMAMASTAYIWAIMNDPERKKLYDRLEDWDKDSSWHFWGAADENGERMHYRVPKPFEVGFLYGTTAEHFYRALTGDEAWGKLAERMGAGVYDQLQFNPWPQAIRPIKDVQANKSSFSGRPIENLGDEGKLPWDRYDERTSPIARGISEVTGKGLTAIAKTLDPEAGSVGMGPKQIQYLWDQYTAGVGQYALGVADSIVRRFGTEADTNLAEDAAGALGFKALPGEPAKKYPNDIPGVGWFFKKEDGTGYTKYQTDLYDAIKEADQVNRSIKSLRESGEDEKADKLESDNQVLLGFRKPFGSVKRRLGQYRDEMDRIRKDPDMSPEEKRKAIDYLLRERNTLVEDVYGDYRAARQSQAEQ